MYKIYDFLFKFSLIFITTFALTELLIFNIQVLEKFAFSSITLLIQEEVFKLLALCLSYYLFRNGYLLGYSYTLCFSIIEYINYIQLYKYSICFNVPIEFYIGRGFCVIVHLVTFSIIYLSVVVSKKYKNFILAINGFLLAILVHLIWNLSLGRLLFKWLDLSNKICG